MADEVTDIQTSATTETAQTDAPVVDAAAASEATAQADDATALGGPVEAKADDAANEGDKAATVEGAPETYELAAPEGFTITDDAKALAEPVFRDLNLTNDQANKLMPVAAKFADQIKTGIEQQMLQAVTAQRKDWLDTAQADPDIGGAKWADSMALAGKALDAAGHPAGSPFRNFLNETGLGNHPEMIKWAVKVGQIVGEDSDFVRSDAGAAVKVPTEKVLYPND